MKVFESKELFADEFQKRLNRMIEDESIFNEIYVNAILNPSNSLNYDGEDLQ